MSANNTAVAQSFDYLVTLAAVPGTDMMIKVRKDATLGRVLAHAITIKGCNKVLKKGAADSFSKMAFSVNGRSVGQDYVFTSNTTVTITENYQGNDGRTLWERIRDFFVSNGD